MGHPIFAAMYDRIFAVAERSGLSEMRAGIVGKARGRTLEIGGGTGLNLPHYTDALTSLVMVEPDQHMARRLRERIQGESAPVPVEVVEAAAEELPFEDGCFDTVVSTFVFCSVGDPARAAGEVRRVLADDGHLLLLEHVRDPDNETRRRWQDRLERPWGLFTGGCPPNRDTPATLAAAGFDLDIEHDEFPRGGPLVKPVVRGSAVQATDRISSS